MLSAWNVRKNPNQRKIYEGGIVSLIIISVIVV